MKLLPVNDYRDFVQRKKNVIDILTDCNAVSIVLFLK